MRTYIISECVYESVYEWVYCIYIYTCFSAFFSSLYLPVFSNPYCCRDLFAWQMLRAPTRARFVRFWSQEGFLAYTYTPEFTKVQITIYFMQVQLYIWYCYNTFPEPHDHRELIVSVNNKNNNKITTFGRKDVSFCSSSSASHITHKCIMYIIIYTISYLQYSISYILWFLLSIHLYSISSVILFNVLKYIKTNEYNIEYCIFYLLKIVIIIFDAHKFRTRLISGFNIFSRCQYRNFSSWHNYIVHIFYSFTQYVYQARSPFFYPLFLIFGIFKLLDFYIN